MRLNADTRIDREATVLVGQHLFGITTLDQSPPDQGQVVSAVLIDMLTDPDSAKSGRAMEAMLQMKKLDMAELQRAFAG